MLIENHFLQVLGGLALGDLFIFAHLLGDFHDDFKVALGFPNGFNGLILKGDVLELNTLTGVGDDVIYFHGGIGRKDNIGIEGVIFQPGMLHHDGFDLGISVGFYGLVAAVPAGGAAGIIAPHHVDFGAAIFLSNGIGIFFELVFNRGFDGSAAREGNGA